MWAVPGEMFLLPAAVCRLQPVPDERGLPRGCHGHQGPEQAQMFTQTTILTFSEKLLRTLSILANRTHHFILF